MSIRLPKANSELNHGMDQAGTDDDCNAWCKPEQHIHALVFGYVKGSLGIDEAAHEAGQMLGFTVLHIEPAPEAFYPQGKVAPVIGMDGEPHMVVIPEGKPYLMIIQVWQEGE